MQGSLVLSTLPSVGRMFSPRSGELRRQSFQIVRQDERGVDQSQVRVTLLISPGMRPNILTSYPRLRPKPPQYSRANLADGVHCFAFSKVLSKMGSTATEITYKSQ